MHHNRTVTLQNACTNVSARDYCNISRCIYYVLRLRYRSRVKLSYPKYTRLMRSLFFGMPPVRLLRHGIIYICSLLFVPFLFFLYIHIYRYMCVYALLLFFLLTNAVTNKVHEYFVNSSRCYFVFHRMLLMPLKCPSSSK